MANPKTVNDERIQQELKRHEAQQKDKNDAMVAQFALEQLWHVLPDFSLISKEAKEAAMANQYFIAPPPAVEPSFETNLTEALVGWKCWKVSGDRIYSSHGTNIWIPDRAFVASCPIFGKYCKESPSVHCSCGIYAADSADAAQSYGTVTGQISGWGRYVRGTAGWRAQYAYPKFFLLKSGQEGLIETLRLYHVPIRIMQAVEIYSPQEDGYEHGNDDQTWDRGAGTNAAAGESAGSAAEYEEDDED